MSMIRGWLTGALRVLDDFAEQRIRHAVGCPECGHGVPLPEGDRPVDCPCDWPACPCAYEEEESRG